MSKKLPDDLQKFRDSYAELFGTLPALPAGRFAFSGDVNPEFLRTAEELRAQAFYNKSFDLKTTQLILFGMLLVEHNQIAAQAHASAARRAGASWEELQRTKLGRRARVAGLTERVIDPKPSIERSQRDERRALGKDAA